MANAAPQWFERPLTHHDLDDLPEDDRFRYEVIDGELYVAPFPFVAHQRAVTRLVALIGMYLETHSLGEVFTSNTKVVLDELTGVGPDLVYVSHERSGDLKRDGFYGPPDLVVEVTSSKPSLDRVVKHRKYAKSGVPHYWIIDPETRTLEAFELKGKRYKLVAAAKGDETFSPKLFPGLAIPLTRLWK
jgi:Uma2 family endonuclease